MITLFIFTSSQSQTFNKQNQTTLMKKQIQNIQSNLTKIERYEQMERIAKNLIDMEIE